MLKTNANIIIVIVGIYIPLNLIKALNGQTLAIRACVHMFNGQATYYTIGAHSPSCDIHLKLPSTQLYVYTPGLGEAGDNVYSAHLHTMMNELVRESNPWPLARSPTP